MAAATSQQARVWAEAAAIFRRDFTAEIRKPTALSGLLLYVAGCVLISYFSLSVALPHVWVALFWLVMLFASITAVAKSFVADAAPKQLFYYITVSPQGFFVGKMLYNTLLLALVGLLCSLGFALVLHFPIKGTAIFATTIAFGSIGLSALLTMVSAISYRAHNAGMLMAVLAFPIIIPLLVLCLSISKAAIETALFERVQQTLTTLALVDAIAVSLGYLLFPYLWRG